MVRKDGFKVKKVENLYKVGNKFVLLPTLYYVCNAMMNEGNTGKQRILDYASSHGRIGFAQLVSDLGLSSNTARQYLSALTKAKKLVRVSNGEYMLPDKQIFMYLPTKDVEKLYNRLKEELPFTDFCIYDGSIFNPLQHHISVNRAIYVETNRDAVDAVFFHLKDTRRLVFKQPGADVMYNYVNLQEPCVIVKTLVTESPVNKVNGVPTPTLEKLLVDIQKDDDLDYMRGIESLYMFQTAIDQYVVNTPKMLRYAKRRGAYENINSLIKQTQRI